ncbi:hypothetical protein [Komagataeibacter oboediens]|uniref:hypothetical protein n=1 Tax=Komagataeibacter oboediens TaxID=65958 RepID=UPI001C2DC44D|nr:hypothetical protein [Komagataeibacter oboediens]MBV1824858.1 hypothetical protein [Komagataeibacter oboediens]
MKAGRAGSIPDDVATKSTDRVSHPLTNLLKEIGEAVANLNTLVVGLDAVESGHEKPESLDISWSPIDRRIAARRSRKFVLEAVLVRVAEAISEYVTALSKLPQFATVRSKWDGNTSASDRVADVLECCLGNKNFVVPATVLLVHWRNRIVHRKSKAKLDTDHKRLLQENDDEISDKYKHLNVDCLLCHFEEQRPTLKDVSSLISMSIRAARDCDKHIQINLSKDALDAWLTYYDIFPILARVKAETAPEKLDAAIRRVLRANAPLLLDSYNTHYFPLDDAQEGITQKLSSNES